MMVWSKICSQSRLMLYVRLFILKKYVRNLNSPLKTNLQGLWSTLFSARWLITRISSRKLFMEVLSQLTNQSVKRSDVHYNTSTTKTRRKQESKWLRLCNTSYKLKKLFYLVNYLIPWFMYILSLKCGSKLINYWAAPTKLTVSQS